VTCSSSSRNNEYDRCRYKGSCSTAVDSVSRAFISRRERVRTFVELFPKRIPYLRFDFDPMVSVANLVLALGLFCI
jgi:hypothetical protein